MTLLRSIVVLVTLLAQAWPVQTASCEDTMRTRQMACCSSLLMAGMDECGCAESSRAATPVDLPPAGARQIVAQVVWADSHGTGPCAMLPRVVCEHDSRPLEAKSLKQPHVRLSVLFCSLLN